MFRLALARVRGEQASGRRRRDKIRVHAIEDRLGDLLALLGTLQALFLGRIRDERGLDQDGTSGERSTTKFAFSTNPR